MDTWEHMTVDTDRQDWDGALTVSQTRGPRYQRGSIDFDQGITGDRILRHLDGLGQEGWHLVHVQTAQEMNHTYRTYWLRRRAQ